MNKKIKECNKKYVSKKVNKQWNTKYYQIN